MAIFGCNCKDKCVCLSVVSSIIIGIVVTFLRLTAVITVTPAFLFVVFGVAVAYLAITLLASVLAQRERVSVCVCGLLPALLTGILGTILLSVVLLAIEFAATSIIGAIVTGGLAFFFWLTITATACLVKCFARCHD